MLIPDANVLLYAVNEDAGAHHVEAKVWLDEALSGAEVVGFAWVVVLAFVRVATHAGIFERPLSVDEAMGAVEAWLDQPSAVTVEPTTRHISVLRGLLSGVGSGGNLVTDAHVAALAAEHAAEVVTYDADFGRFPGVRSRKPTLGDPSAPPDDVAGAVGNLEQSDRGDIHEG